MIGSIGRSERIFIQGQNVLMGEQMPRQGALQAGTVIAVGTLEALLSSVHQQVRRQVNSELGGSTIFLSRHPKRKNIFYRTLVFFLRFD